MKLAPFYFAPDKGTPPLALSDVAVISDQRAKEVLAVNSALERLTAMDARKG